ncbi:alpha/beta hydrolase [Bacillus carboniphilus]|uniref:Alpha/beta hydrolase n=1 Tax=Bacillus carboniphilus TaxID=86663 RepID=A0ABN0W8N5_9BACI
MKFMNIQGVPISYYDKGEGIPLVLIHPPGFGHKVFYRQFPLTQYFRCIIPDLSGHGNSGVYKVQPTIDDYVEELRALMEHLSVESFFLFGYSSGGSVAQAFSIKYPHKVRGLLLSGAYPKVSSTILNVEHRIGIWLAKNHPKILSKMLSTNHGIDKHSTLELYWYLRKSNPRVWANFYKEALHFNCVRQLQQLTMPVLLLYGSLADPINKSVRIYKKYLQPEIIFINKATHQLPVYHAEEINVQIINFIKVKDQASTKM